MSALRLAIAEHQAIWRGVQLSAAAALGTALPDLLAIGGRIVRAVIS